MSFEHNNKNCHQAPRASSLFPSHDHHHGGGGSPPIRSGSSHEGMPDQPDRTNDTESQTRTDSQVFELGEDVYSLIFISPVCSGPFVFAMLTICLKLALFTFLAIDLAETAAESGSDFLAGETTLIRATEFCLMPVAVAIQEDLIYVYTRVANIRYDKTLTQKEETEHATEFKFALSFLLRFLDGIYSLIINFTLLLITTEVLGIFLNFAALQFLQSIDDIAFQLAAHGYLGDTMEDFCKTVTRTTLPKRVGDSFTNALDSVLFFTTYAVMLAVWTFSVISHGNNEE